MSRVVTSMARPPYAVVMAHRKACGGHRSPKPAHRVSYPREREYLLLARLLVAEGDPERALELLERLRAEAAAQGRTGSVIEVRTLQVLALDASGNRARALDALAEALALGAPEGYLRVFVDEGPPMAALIRQLLLGRRPARP